MNTITRIHAREVLDSRGRPTVEVEAYAGDCLGRAIVPSGASTGAAEAIELRDGNPRWYCGLGVRNAVRNVNEILAPALVGTDPVAQQHVLDERLMELDGTSQKSRLGGNSLLGVSLAAAHLAAALQRVPLWVQFHKLWQQTSGDQAAAKMPRPMTNMISGGLHAGGNLDFQDVLLVPDASLDYPAQLQQIVAVYNRLGKLLNESGYEGRLVGDEGGYGPRLPDNRSAVEFVVRAIESAGFTPGDVTIAIDVAATHFYRDGQYYLNTEQGRPFTSEEMIARMEDWVREFPIVSIEDALAEEDWDGWVALTQRLGNHVSLVGDDLFVTNASRLQRGIELGAANSVLVKLNQIGTVTEAFRAMRLAREHKYSLVVSARSGETEDTSIADLAVAVAAEYIKIGSIVRSERLAKYNQLLRIDEQFRLGVAAG